MLVNTKVDTTVVWGGEGTDSGDQADEADDGGTLCFDSFSEPAPPAPGPEATQNTAKTKRSLGVVVLVAVGLVGLIGLVGRGLFMGDPTPIPTDTVEVQSEPPAETVAPPTPKPEPEPPAETVAPPTPEPEPKPVKIAPSAKTKAAPKKAAAPSSAPAETKQAPKASATANAKKSQAFINARPWATLEIDGAAVGRTGWKGQLTAGSHHIKLTAGDGRTHSQTFLVTEGKPARVCWNFDLSARCQR
jgi:outer membrane biosynthesis protein TonB